MQTQPQTKLITLEKFSSRVQDLIDQDPDLDAVDAVVAACEEFGVEIESTHTILSADLKTEIQRAFERRNMMKAKSKLDL